MMNRNGNVEGKHGKSHSEMAMAISYNWLFLWDYTVYKWGYKYL